jgi:hypothetical protein
VREWRLLFLQEKINNSFGEAYFSALFFLGGFCGKTNKKYLRRAYFSAEKAKSRLPFRSCRVNLCFLSFFRVSNNIFVESMFFSALKEENLFIFRS